MLCPENARESTISVLDFLLCKLCVFPENVRRNQTNLACITFNDFSAKRMGVEFRNSLKCLWTDRRTYLNFCLKFIQSSARLKALKLKDNGRFYMQLYHPSVLQFYCREVFDSFCCVIGTFIFVSIPPNFVLLFLIIFLPLMLYSVQVCYDVKSILRVLAIGSGTYF